jgi:hypothetical protein
MTKKMKENGNQKHFFISIIQNTIPKKSVNQKKMWIFAIENCLYKYATSDLKI